MPLDGRARALVLLGLVVLPLLAVPPSVRASQVGLQGAPTLAPFDSDGDGKADAAHVTQVVATSLGTVTATLEGHLFPPDANPNASWTGWVGAAFDTQTVMCTSAAGCNSTFSLDLYAPVDGAQGSYRVVLNLTTTQTMAESIAAGSAVSGTFPAAIAADDGTVLQYREAGGALEADLAYRSNTGPGLVSGPKARTWGGAALGPETELPTAGSPIRAIRVAWSPIALEERILVTQSDDGWLDAYVCAATCNVTNNIGQVWTAAPGTPERRFDVAYEGLSGEALLVYGVLSPDPALDLAYRTYRGGVWSAEQYLDDTGHTTDVQYTLVKLAAKAGSDAVGLAAGDDTNNDVNAWVWDGTAFGSAAEITASARSPNEQEADLAWESASGDLVVVAAQAGSTNIAAREFTTNWGPVLTSPCANAGAGLWLSLKSNPVSTANDMVLAVGDSGSMLSTCYWDGTAWANWTPQDPSLDFSTSRPFDFAWHDADSAGLLVYGTSGGQITRRPFTAPNAWGAPTSMAMGTNPHRWVQLRTNPSPDPGSTKVLGAVLEDVANDLGVLRWDGIALTVIATDALTSDVGSTPTSHDSFDIAYRIASDDRLSFRYDWTGGAFSGESAMLRVRGHREDEDVRVQVLAPPSTWTTRVTISTTSSALYSYALTSEEYNAGSPSIQFVDASGAGGTLSNLWLDWVAVVPNATQSAGTTRTAELRLEPRSSGLRPPPTPFEPVALAIGAAIGVAAATASLVLLRSLRRGKRDEATTAPSAFAGWLAPVAALWPRHRLKKIDVKAGKGYFVETFQRDAALQIVVPFIQRGYTTLVISRVHPDEIKRMLPFDDAHPLWLIDYSEQTAKKVDAVPPSLEKLFFRASTFMESTLRTAVVIDGLEFLVDNSNFSSVMRFLRRLIDIVAQRDCLLLVIAAPDAFGPKERSNLERELSRIPL